jgi:hypothetical protein
MTPMRKRIFSFDNQIAFAAISGDNNPLHVDPLVARRSLFGQPIVHGVHSLMWALDCWLEGRSESVRLELLQVVFLKPIGLNQEVRFSLVSEQKNRVRIDLLKGDEIAVRIAFEWSVYKPISTEAVFPDLPKQQPPELLNRETIQSCNGFLDLYLRPVNARQLLPNLFRLFCPLQSAILLGMTRLVGVKCPGLNSIFSELKLVASDTGSLQKIKYSVSEFEDRYGLVLMSVTAPGLSGTIKAFVRPQAQIQTTFLDLKKSIKPDAFVGQRALVVGGSRGLGEVAAKILAAGGADVQLTYRVGKRDAQNVVDEIVTGGGQANFCELDVLQPQNKWAGPTAPTHLYYFCQPFHFGFGEKIFTRAVQ